jgi:hypothetical protein
VAGDEATDAAGHDRKEGGKESAQNPREGATQEQPRCCVHGLGDVLLGQFDPRKDVLQNPRHGEEADEGWEQVLVGRRHRHEAAVKQNEPQETGEQECDEPGREALPAVPPSSPACRRTVRALGPLGEQHEGDHSPQDPVQVRLEDGPQCREEGRGDGCQQCEYSDAAQASDAGEHGCLVPASLEEVLLPWQDDEEGGIVGGGEEDAGDGIQHRVAGDQPQEEHRQELRWQQVAQRGRGQDDEPRDIVDVQRGHEREY